MALFPISAMIFYCIALVLVTTRLFHEKGPNRKLIAIMAAIAIVFHAFALHKAIFTHDGQNLSLTNVISIVNWIIAIAFTIFIFRLKVITVLPVIYIFSIISVAALWILPPKLIIHFNSHPAILVHIIFSLISYSALMIAALYAIQLAIIQNKLKNKKMILHPSMPPLMTVEKQLYHLVLIGFILLTLSLFTGVIFLENMFTDGKGHKAILSIAAWLVYAIMLGQHCWIGCKMRSAVIYSLTGATLLSLAYFGARVVKELILH